MAEVLLPVPDRDGDPTEIAVPWRVLTDAGHRVIFATEAGAAPAVDPLLLTGVIFGKLGAAPDALACHEAMAQTPAWQRPISFAEAAERRFAGLLLPGGHAPGMRQYLESEALFALTAAHFLAERPTAAICHGALVMARARHPETGASLLAGRRTTCLPGYMERLAYWLTFWKLGRYYRTYPAYVQTEVQAALGDGVFERGPLTLGTRGTATDDRATFVVEDGHYVSARWPGDAWIFARALLARLG